MALTHDKGHYTRIPFEEAIAEALLFKKSWEKFSTPQQVVLKSIYGLPLSPTELQHWSAFNGFAETDELGFLTGVTGSFPYTPGHHYEDTTLIIGRRFGKSTLCAFISAYEALCGGHREFVEEKQDPNVLWVAQDLGTAKSNLRQFSLQFLEQSPIGKKELIPMTQRVTAEQIRLKSALITVAAPTIKIRSQACAVALLDEIAFWSKERDSANPDTEVEAAIAPSMLQFPFRKLIKLSTPWTEEGILWNAAQAGTHNRFQSGPPDPLKVVLHATTAMSENPRMTPKVMRSYLERQRVKDAEAFRREYLAEFSKSVSGFLPTSLLIAATDSGVKRREPKAGNIYVATLDPGFRRDAFALCIGHINDQGQWEMDHLQWQYGTHDHPLSPSVCLGQAASVCRDYGVRVAVSDQYHSESLQELAHGTGISLESQFLTPKVKSQMWGEVSSQLAQNRLRLLDHPQLINELQKMEKRLTPNGNVQFSGKQDDLAMVMALNVLRSLQYGWRAPVTPISPVQNLSKEVRARVLKRREGSSEWWNQ